MAGRAARHGAREQIVLSIVFVACAVALVERDWLWRFDGILYDAALRLVATEPPDDIVLVAIDEASLRAIGRWPWSRRTHAELVDRLTDAGASVIALDVIFAEPDRSDPRADLELAESLARSARVVLPVLLEQPRAGGQLVEQLPLPALAAAAAALGHVHVELDQDGIARGTHLLEGLGHARWPALAVAMLRTRDPGALQPLPGLRAPVRAERNARVWARDHRVLIPYIGPPNSMPRISYVHALRGDHARDAFADKLVLVGATATGLGDALPTPVSGFGQPMSGVEINANLLHALREASVIRELRPAWRMLLFGLLAAAPVLLYTRLGPRYGLLAGVLMLAGVLGASVALLPVAHIWPAPAPLVAVLLTSYPVWSWLRLEMAMRYLRRESRRIAAQEAARPRVRRPDLSAAMSFLSGVLPLRGWVLADRDGVRVGGAGDEPPGPTPVLARGEWRQRGEQLWGTVVDVDREWRIGATWGGAAPPNDAERRLLSDLAHSYGRSPTQAPADSVEIVQAQIDRVEAANERLNVLRRVVDDSISQMSDAVVVASSIGQVLVANQQAGLYLKASASTTLVGEPLMDLLDEVSVEGEADWTTLLREVLVERRPHVVNARHRSGRDLLVQVAPLTGGAGEAPGLIVNASDITELRANERRRAEMLSFLSHDLRSPLISVLAVLELGRDQASGEAGDLLARIEHYTRTTLELAEQFVELVRAETQEDLSRHEVDLVEVTSNAVDQVFDQARAKSIHIERELTTSEAYILGDGALLERAVANLVNNAVKYSEPRTRIRVQVEQDDGEVRVSVTDQGHGIAPESMGKLFRRFERLGQSGSARERGAGLGLAFVKIVAERHHGRVEVDSVPGRGSQFRLVFPVQA